MKESGEMYLKEIYYQTLDNSKLKSIDLAKKRKVSKASVSKAISIIKKKGYIKIDSEGNIILTKAGLEYAKDIVDKYETIYTFFRFSLDIPECIAKKNACKMEHDITDACLIAMKNKIKETDDVRT